MTSFKNSKSRARRDRKSGMLRLVGAGAMVVIASVAIMTIAVSPILSTTVSKPPLAASRGISLTVNPAFKSPERAQSAKNGRLVVAKDSQSRAKPQLAAADIRRAFLAGRVKQAGQMALADLQRTLVGKQIADNSGSEIALAGVPPELTPKSAPPPAPAAPSTALLASASNTQTSTRAGSAFGLVLQGADSRRMSPGEVPVPAKRPAGMQLAYASFGHDDLDDIMRDVPAHSAKVAVYDISAGKVYMPDGEVMEAHSGKGKYRDNPEYTHVKMAGAVPAATYRLSMRKALFHGVPAIRMTSVDGTHPLGRTGLLAHTYMLRTPGDSHGCLVFKDYYKFLKAYRSGRVDYIVAVPSMEKGLPAALESRSA